MTVSILQGDVRAVLATLPADHFDCCVTSPPYFGLRDYGVEGQIGLEPTLAEYLATMVDVCRGVRRVLKPEGTFWLNIGDSYAGSWGAQSRGGAPSDKSTLKGNGHQGGGPKIKSLSSVQIEAAPKGQTGTGSLSRTAGLKSKDLMMVPNRLAILLQDDGWYVRSEIIWHKPNPMPESVTDRPTGAHEKIWLLTRSPKYFYDAEAVLVPASPNTHARLSQDVQNQVGSARANGGAKTNGNMKAVGRKLAPEGEGIKNNGSFDAAMAIMPSMRNLRNVWSVTTQPFKEAHFATFPPALAETCIKAGCPVGGHVLDPFGGAGTTGLVADRLGRHATLIELNSEYIEIARRRIEGDAPLLTALS